MKIAFVGDLTMDIYPELKKSLPGGASLFGAMWAKKSGAEVSIFAAIGDDDAAQKFKNFLTTSDLSWQNLKILKGKTSSIEIFLEKKGERFFGEWNPGVYRKYHLQKKDLNLLWKYDAVVVPLYKKTQHLVDELVVFKKQKAKSGNHPVLAVDFDDLSQYGKKTEILKKYLPYIDIVKTGLDPKKETVLLNMLKVLSSQHPGAVILVTLGKHGSLVFQNGKTTIQKTKELKCQNSTGAGDAFLAGFLTEYLKNRKLKKALQNGNMTAKKHLLNFDMIN